MTGCQSVGHCGCGPDASEVKLLRSEEVCPLRAVNDRILWSKACALRALYTCSAYIYLASEGVKLLSRLYRKESKSTCPVANEKGTVSNKPFVSFLSTFYTPGLFEILGKITPELCVWP